MMQQEALYLDYPNGTDKIFVQRIFEQKEGIPVFCLHGSIESGRIFYSEDMSKGLAPWLASKGFDVFVPDLRGKGKSTPAIKEGNNYGQHEVITKQIPFIADAIKSIKGDQEQIWISHSWGGNMMNASFARFQPAKVKALVHFGLKRRITVWNWARLYMIQYGWYFMGNRWAKTKGYLPYTKQGFGADEPVKLWSQINQWIKEEEWKSTEDGFDYRQACRNTNMPKALWLAGAGDKVLANPIDVQKTKDEVGNEADHLELLGRKNGYSKDYDHNNMLTSKSAPDEIFPKVLNWIS